MVTFMDDANDDILVSQAWTWIKDCKQRRNAYWRLHNKYVRYNNYISIPLLIVASATGITSMSQVNTNVASYVSWLIAGLGILSTALAGMQRYFQFGEKAEQAKMVANQFGNMARKAEAQVVLYEVGAMAQASLVSFMEVFRKEIDDAQLHSITVPDEILDRSHVVNPLQTVEEIRQNTISETASQPLPKVPKRTAKCTATISDDTPTARGLLRVTSV